MNTIRFNKLPQYLQDRYLQQRLEANRAIHNARVRAAKRKRNESFSRPVGVQNNHRSQTTD